jgi:hypothetical protein
MKNVRCATIVAVGWVIGCLLMVFYSNGGSRAPTHIGTRGLSTKLPGGLRGQYADPFLTSAVRPEILTTVQNDLSGGSSSSERLEGSRILPKFPRNGNSSTTPGTEAVSAANSEIYLDWPLDARLFTLENYHSLESMLTHHPNSKYYFLSSNTNPMHHTDSLLPINNFVKYTRLGYDLGLSPANSLPVALTAKVGKQYWAKWKRSSANQCRDEECRKFSNRPLPYHVLTYIRLVKLWRNGGIFSDFSFLFLGSVDRTVVRQVCIFLR